MTDNGINLIEVKEYNRALIIQLICTNHSPTRNFLAEKSSLTKMTLTNITTELMQKDLIQEADCAVSNNNHTIKPGRIPKTLELAPNSPLVIGIWISKGFLYGIITDLKLNILTASRVNFCEEETPDTIIEKLIELSRHLSAYSSRPLLGLGLAAIGIINSQDGIMENAINFFGIHNLHLKELLEKELQIPVFVKNDMQAAALCELYYGHGKKKDNFIYVGIGTGVGAAAVAGRKLLNATTGAFGEIGHLSIDCNGPSCNCGSRGCLELYASCPNITEQLNEACNTSFPTFSEAMEYSELNVDAHNTLFSILDKLSFGLNSLVNILGIQDVIIGNEGYFFSDKALEYLEQSINQISVLRKNREIKVRRSSFDSKTPLFGAACIVLDQLFCGNLSL